jgi:hypothetical protein
MYIQIGYQEYFYLSSINNFDDLIEGLNDLLGENSYIIEKNGKKIDLSSEEKLLDDETYKIWPKVFGGKVNNLKKKNIFIIYFILFFRVVLDHYYVHLVNKFLYQKIKKLVEI